jgi:hypothetical protein
LVAGVESRHTSPRRFATAETDKAKTGRLQKRREKQQVKREQTGDTPQAAAERAKRSKEYDEDALKKLGERTGTYI